MTDKHSGFFSGLLRRNEIFLFAAAGLFLGSMVVSYFSAGLLDAYLSPILSSFKQRITSGTLKIETFSIFINNVMIAAYIYLGGILLGVVSAFILITNGLFVGYVAAQFPLGNFLIYTIPHGIFEITGIIFAGAAGFKLGSIVFKFLNDVTKVKRNISIKNQISYLLKININDFKDSLALLIIAAVLLIIAAFVEANLTYSWGLFIQSLL